MAPSRILAAGLALISFLYCSSAPPYRPADFNDFFQGEWTMVEKRCDRDGDCDKSGKGEMMIVQGNKIAMVKANAEKPSALLLYRLSGSDRLRLTNLETGRTFLGSVVFRTEKEILIESRRIPASFEKWQRRDEPKE